MKEKRRELSKVGNLGSKEKREKKRQEESLKKRVGCHLWVPKTETVKEGALEKKKGSFVFEKVREGESTGGIFFFLFFHFRLLVYATRELSTSLLCSSIFGC